MDEAKITHSLKEPTDPYGRRITWEHPYLVTMAEWGRIPASPEHEDECVKIVAKLSNLGN